MVKKEVSFNKNDLITVTIEDMGNEGEGIGKAEGYALFIKDAILGDVVRCKIMKAKKNYAYARLEEIITPSELRTEPRCRFHKQCGGCQIQCMDYQAQLVWKQKKIKNHLVRIGGFEEAFIESKMEPIVGMEKPYRYRNKAQYPIGTDKNGEPVTGFYAGRTHDIIPNTDCMLGAEENQEILEKLLVYMKKNKVTAYDEKSGTGLLRHVLIRKGFTSGEILVCLVLNAERKLWEESRAVSEEAGKGHRYNGRAVSAETSEGHRYNRLWAQEELIASLSKIKGMTGICLNFNPEQTNVILGKEIMSIWGKEWIEDTIHVRDTEQFKRTGDEISFHISPLSFYQVNPVQTEKLYSLALEYAGLTGKETVWDLYCGIGTISLFLARKAGKVYGVEVVPEAIEDAKRNAKLNHIKNAEFFAGKAEEILPEFYRTKGIKADVIVVDPPRKGCDSACLDTMLKMQPDRIVYVSCDSATLARDLRILADGGYQIEKVRGVDQFGQTVHCEVCVEICRIND